MANFKESFDITMRAEGGYCNYSSDAGKETYRGISIVHNPDWKGWVIVHEAISYFGIKNTLDVSKVTRDLIDTRLAKNTKLDIMVKDLYKEKYWNPLNLDNENDQKFANHIFDISVNQGPSIAKKAQMEAENA